ncbi:4Fe-4S binding protein [Aminomonas paucivorans]|uniref:4Fe-4S binding protein n=1 Tax=Aminomonas paucivorans TaxID=81412 RepID=UPI003320F0B6
MLNRMTVQALRQICAPSATNPFPAKHMPESLSGFLRDVAEGKRSLCPPVEPPEGYRGRIAYDRGKCIGCRLCIKVCPANAIEFVPEEKKIRIHVDRCCFCEQCTEICPVSCLWMTRECLVSGTDRREQVVVDSGPKP